MKIQHRNIYARTFIGFLAAAFFVVSFGGASIVGPLPVEPSRIFVVDQKATQTLRELAHLELLVETPEPVLEDLLSFQAHSGQSLPQILKSPRWAKKFGLNPDSFIATWYAANPFELLPRDLQLAIRQTSTPFESRKQIKQWCQKQDAPDRWIRALNLSLIETTPINLWRASRGKKPFAKNGQYLEPIVVEKGRGQFEVRDGHIATDPRIIPTNSRVLMLVRVNGQDRVIRVKATDIGEAIRGRHVDLPIAIKSRATSRVHSIWFPHKYIRNSTVTILLPSKKISRGQKG